jgi:hypothetical protein
MVRIAAVCDTLDVLAQQYSAIGSEIASTQGHAELSQSKRNCRFSKMTVRPVFAAAAGDVHSIISRS